MNQRELKEKAIDLLNESDKAYSFDAQRNMILAAQVYATLALVDDPKVIFNA